MQLIGILENFRSKKSELLGQKQCGPTLLKLFSFEGNFQQKLFIMQLTKYRKLQFPAGRSVWPKHLRSRSQITFTRQGRYSWVPNKRVYSISIFKFFSHPTRTFSTLLDQEIFNPTRLLGTLFFTILPYFFLSIFHFLS